MKMYRSDPLTEREKAYLRRKLGVQPFHGSAVGPAPIDKPKERAFITEIKPDYRAPRKRRGGSGCRMSPEVRAMVESRKASRRAFFASLGVEV